MSPVPLPDPGARAMTRRAVTRRSVLGLVAGAAVAGAVACSPGGGSSADSSSESASSSPDPDAPLRTDVATSEASLIALYDVAIAAQPSLATALTPLRDQHQEHADAVQPASSDTATASAQASSLGPASSGAQSTFPTAEAALEALMQAELGAAEQRTQSCGAAADSDLARTLALIAASEASHAEALKAVGT